MPVRNGAPTLPACLDSIRCQTFPDFEVIAIDDHSKDGSGEILHAAARRDPRIRVEPAHGAGLVDALNQGLAAARASLVARMDCDDEMVPDRLAVQVDHLDEHPSHVLVASRVRVTSVTPLTDGFAEYIRWMDGCVTPEDLREEIYVESPFAHPTVMFRTEAIRALGGYRAGNFPEDYDLWLRLVAAGHTMAKIPRELVTWTDHPGRTTRTDPRYEREAFDRLRAEHLARDPRLSADRRLMFWGAGRSTRKRTRHLVARGFRPHAWIDVDPDKIGNPVAGIPVVDPDYLLKDSTAPRPFVLVFVAAHGAREKIAGRLARRGFARGLDYLMVG